MSENDFQQINQNQYRGSRYSSFVGGGASSAGNVTPAYSENSANTVASTDPNLQQGVTQPNRNFDNSLNDIKVPDPILKGPSSGLVTSGLQYAAPTIGARVGLNTAMGQGIEGAFSGVGSDLASSVSSGLAKVSGGLIGSTGAETASSIAGRLGSLSNSLSGASANSGAGMLSRQISGAKSGTGFGSAAGAGLASAATVLLTGGSVKDAAFSGVGAALGSFIPIPIIGSMIGSFIGSKIGSLFGNNKPSDKSQGSILNLSDFTSSDYGQTGSKFSQENRDFVTKVRDSAKGIAEALRGTGAKFTGSLNLMVGNRDGLRLNGTNYGRNADSFIDSVGKSVFKSASFDDPSKQNILESGLTKNMSLDDIYNSLTGTYNPPSISKPRQATFYS